ncbi:MAG: ATP-binding protein, partial [Candidatus Bathyarchaeia archaeon]
MESSNIFEEWNTYALRKVLLQRNVNLDAIERNSESKIVAITGIRRCGKSSVLMLLAQKLAREGKEVCYVNVEDSRLGAEKNVLDQILKWFGDEGFLLLDEITSANDWSGWLARTHELLKGRLHLVVGSSRRSLVVPSKSLRGRILPIELFPLSFKEFLVFKRIEVESTTVGIGRLERALSEYLTFGGFPEVVLAEDALDKVRIIDSYFKDIVGLDVAEVSHEDPTTVATFGRCVIQSTYFSASKCLNFFKSLGYKIGKEKLLQLEKHSEAGYLFFFIPVFSHSLKARSAYPRKAYNGDVGFSYAATGKTDWGKLYENAVFLELKRRSKDQEICYWRNKAGEEVDFLVKRGGELFEAYQVVYDLSNAATERREVEGLISCVKELKPNTSVIITKNVSETR